MFKNTCASFVCPNRSLVPAPPLYVQFMRAPLLSVQIIPAPSFCLQGWRGIRSALHRRKTTFGESASRQVEKHGLSNSFVSCYHLTYYLVFLSCVSVHHCYCLLLLYSYTVSRTCLKVRSRVSVTYCYCLMQRSRVTVCR